MKVHICDQLQNELIDFDSNVRLKKDSNSIGEEIASARSDKGRWIEVIREKDREEFSFMVRIKGALIGFIMTNDCKRTTLAIDEIISKNIAPETIYTSNFGFTLPAGLSESLSGDELLIKLTWLDIIDSYQQDTWCSPKMLEIVKSLEASELTNDLVPFISLDRLCLSKNFNSGTKNTICVSHRRSKSNKELVRITSYEDIELWSGGIEQLTEGFRSVVENFPI